MWYEIGGSFYYATSLDGKVRNPYGISWTKWPENPIIDTCPSWSSLGWGYTPRTVLKLDDLYHL